MMRRPLIARYSCQRVGAGQIRTTATEPATAPAVAETSRTVITRAGFFCAGGGDDRISEARGNGTRSLSLTRALWVNSGTTL
jgi:hypothetical protein